MNLIKILFSYLPQDIDSTVSCHPLWHTSKMKGINNTQCGTNLPIWDTYNVAHKKSTCIYEVNKKSASCTHQKNIGTYFLQWKLQALCSESWILPKVLKKASPLMYFVTLSENKRHPE